MLLKSSVVLSDDLESTSSLGIPPVLNLVKYHKLNENMVFRCFVYNKALKAVSQKDLSCFQEHSTDIKDLILDRSRDISTQAINKCPSESFVIDIYIDIPPKSRAFILGFDTLDETSSTLLFTWSEIQSSEFPLIRLVESNSVSNSAYSSYRFPLELSNGEDLSNFTNLEFQDL